MRAAGVELLFDNSRTETIGIVQALKYLPLFLYRYNAFRIKLLEKKPDLLVLVDFGFFNTRLLETASKHGIKCVYYFPPSSWRRKLGRPDALVRSDCRVITPFPWSEKILSGRGLKARYPGHPLTDIAKPSVTEKEYREEFSVSSRSAGFLPGSRKFEIDMHLPPFFGTLRLLREKHPDMTFVFAATPERADHVAKRLKAEFGNYEDLGIRLAAGRTYDVMAYSDVLFTCSGTATLEAGLIGTPMIIVYRGTGMMRFEYFFRKHSLKHDIGLPNIVLEKQVCKEFLGKAVVPEALFGEAERLLSDPELYAEKKKELAGIKRMLGPAGVVERAADAFVDLVKDY